LIEESPPARILVVDDHALSRKLLNRLLEREGYEVDAVGSCAEAVGTAAERSFDLVILDLHLGDGDGLELARVLRSTPGSAGAPIVACTAGVGDGDRRRALDAGCEAYVAKPIDTRGFALLVSSLLSDPHPPDSRPSVRAR
jgi:CheY-like chemotaxis protein